jgi:hypothetical protein
MLPQYVVWRQEVYLYEGCWSYEEGVGKVTTVYRI